MANLLNLFPSLSNCIWQPHCCHQRITTVVYVFRSLPWGTPLTLHQRGTPWFLDLFTISHIQRWGFIDLAFFPLILVVLSYFLFVKILYFKWRSKEKGSELTADSLPKSMQKPHLGQAEACLPREGQKLSHWSHHCCSPRFALGVRAEH